MAAPKMPKGEKRIIVLPVAVDTAMREQLFDDDSGRIPRGAISTYIANLIKRDLKMREPVDLLGLLGDAE